MWFWTNTDMPLFMDSRGERDTKIVNYRILCIYVENQIYRAAVRANRSITHHLRHAAALSNDLGGLDPDDRPGLLSVHRPAEPLQFSMKSTFVL